jgi:hypothetical protein
LHSPFIGFSYVSLQHNKNEREQRDEHQKQDNGNSIIIAIVVVCFITLGAFGDEPRDLGIAVFAIVSERLRPVSHPLLQWSNVIHSIRWLLQEKHTGFYTGIEGRTHLHVVPRRKCTWLLDANARGRHHQPVDGFTLLPYFSPCFILNTR